MEFCGDIDPLLLPQARMEGAKGTGSFDYP